MSQDEHKIMIVGFGVVGQGFFDLLSAKKAEGYFSGCTVTEVVDMKYGFIEKPGKETLDEIKSGKKFPQKNVVDAIRESEADTVCEFTWVNFKNAEPAFSHMKAALESGKNVITTNKGPIALKFQELTSLASRKSLQLKFKGTVMAGTPSYNIMKLLPGSKVRSVRGIMNGTTNYILARMSQGLNFDSALREAQSKGYAEADPTNDIDGFDAAAKAVIVSNVFGWHHSMSNMKIVGIRGVSPEDAASGTKLLVNVTPKSATVEPVRLPENDILRHVAGVMNAMEIETDTLGKIYTMGPGAGRVETAQAALTDLDEILKKQ